MYRNVVVTRVSNDDGNIRLVLRYSMVLQTDRVFMSNESAENIFKNLMRCANDPHVVILSLLNASKNIIDLHDDNDASVIPHGPAHFSIKRDFANGSHVVICVL